MSISDYYHKVIHSGIEGNTPRDESKKIILLNVFCICWLFFALLLVVSDAVFIENSSNNILTHGISIICILFIFYLQHSKKYLFARLLFVFASLTNYLLFANLLEPNIFLEFFLLMIPMFSLLFIDDFRINFAVFLISYMSFYGPIVYFNHYEGLWVNPLTNFILFFATFFLVNYFKNTNLKNERLLEVQRKELEELNTFQSHFLVNLSHEIRTPLTLIKGNSTQLKNSNDLAEIITLNTRIDQNAEKIRLLVDNIIDLAKMNANKLEINLAPINISTFCRHICASFESLFKQKDIHFSFENHIGDPSFLVLVDKLYLERAIGNLFINAHKFTPEHGRVLVEISHEDEQFTFAITDSGCGIPIADIPFIFDSFYRAKNTFNQAGGSGVGLSFSKEVIVLHKGVLDVKSDENAGATFTVSIPAPLLDIEQTETITPQQQSSKSWTGKKILLVEDNHEMRTYLKGVLRDFSITEATNGQEALNILKDFTPDLIITDYMMPKMNGYDFVAAGKANGIDCPVIVLTARMDEEGKLDFLRLGIDDYLTKPFNEEELIIRIQNCFRNYTERNTFLIEEASEVEVAEDLELVRIKDIIYKNISLLSFNVLQLAEELNVTERTLQRKIKSITGLTPNEFIRELKLLKAQELCQQQKVSNYKELALTLGFKNSTHLSNLYEKRFGKKPFVLE